MVKLPPFAVFCLCFVMALTSAGQIKSRYLNNPKTCSDNRCGTTSYETILKWYNHIFLSEEELDHLKIQRNISRNDFINNQLTTSHGYKNIAEYGDGDSCCATSITYKLNYTMNNIFGQEQSIIHMPDAEPPRFQFVPHAECIAQHQNCEGLCLVEPLLLTLLVLKDEDLVFDFFLVPGYCSCKNIVS